MKASQLLDNSVLQAVLSILVWGGIIYMYATKGEVPEGLLSAGSLILGFYFHTAVTETVTRLQAKNQAKGPQT